MTSVLLRFALISILVGLTACGQSDDQAASTPASTAPSAAAAQRDGDTVSLPAGLPVAEDMMPYGEAGDVLLRGFFAYPEAMLEPAPAVLLIHDWFGIDTTTREAARVLAGQGYMVLVADLYGGQTATDARGAGALSRTLLEAPEAVITNIAAAQSFLLDGAGAPSVSLVGWSMGGYWAFESVRLLERAPTAAVVISSQVDQDGERLSQVTIPMLALFAARDRSIPIADVDALRDKVVAFGKDIEVVVVPRVRAGFMDARHPDHDAGAAESTWVSILDFLAAQTNPG